MALIAYNLTSAAVTLSSTTVVLPALVSPLTRGDGIDVSAAMRPDLTVDPLGGIVGGRSAANYTAIQAQIAAGTLAVEWSGGAPPWLVGPATGLFTWTVAAGVQSGSDSDAFHETFIAPVAPATALATVDDNVALATLVLQPGCPRTFDVAFHALWAGGNIVVKGLLSTGVVGSETYIAAAGTTVPGTKAFASIISATNTNTGGAGAHVSTVQTGTQLGVSGGAVDAFYKVALDGVNEAIAAALAAEGTFTPTTALNGVRDFEIYYARTR